MADKATETLLDALKHALAEPVEQRLFRSGKLPGLFSSRTGVNSEAAAQALRDGLLEVVRTEEKGKVSIEWVRLMPRGVEFIHDRESPVRVLQELSDVLKITREGMPGWLAEMIQEWRAANLRLTESVQRMTQRMEALGQRVEEALRRADLSRIQPPNGKATTVAWASAALAYLERRRESGASGECSLPEMFAALRPQQGDLSIPLFLDGLRRLHDRRIVQLLPFNGPPGDLPEPEYALLDGAAVFYYVKR